MSFVPSSFAATACVSLILRLCWGRGWAVCILIWNSHVPSFTLITAVERRRKTHSRKMERVRWRVEERESQVKERKNLLQTWLGKGDRREEIIKQRAGAAAAFQISCQVAGPHSKIAEGRKTARETWREKSRKLKGQNTMSSHHGGGQSQVLTSTNPSLFNAAGHQRFFHHRQFLANKQYACSPSPVQIVQWPHIWHN